MDSKLKSVPPSIKPMLSQQQILTFLQVNLPKWRQKYNIETLGLFGSFARGEATDKSDIDILFQFKKTPEDVFQTKNEMREFLEQKFHRKVDLANKRYLNPISKEHILSEVIYVTEG